MGEGHNKRQRFLVDHPYCIFCGGNVPAATIEHCPPRSVFINRNYPEGFEFPACKDCNQGSSDQDLLVAMLSRMDGIGNKGDIDGKSIGYMKMANKQHPGLFQNMKLSALEARKFNRKAGIAVPPGLTHQQLGVVRLPPEAHRAVQLFSKKLAKSLYYKHTGETKIFPIDGCLTLHWFTNANVILNKGVTVFDLMRNMGGDKPTIERARQNMNDQFEYKITMSNDHDIFIIQASFRLTFGMVIMGSTKRGLLEEIIIKLRKHTAKEGPFTVLQSQILPIA